MDHRTKPGLANKWDSLIEGDVPFNLHSDLLKHDRVRIDALNPEFGGPIRSVIPSPTYEADWSDALFNRFDLLEQ